MVMHNNIKDIVKHNSQLSQPFDDFWRNVDLLCVFLSAGVLVGF